MLKRRQGLHPVILILILAIVFVLAAIGVLLLMGFRYTSNDAGYKFIGKVINDQPVTGKIIYPDGKSATLDYYNNIIEFSNGNRYEGEIYGLYAHGTGKMTYYATGDIYEGEFETDKLTGKGKYIYKNGDYYEGDFVDGKMEGTGKYVWADGSSYVGGFSAGLLDGYGVFTFASVDGASASRYEGNYVNGVKNGEGTYYYDSGNVYMGNYVNDKMNGSGTFKWANGETYVGNFIDNLMDTRIKNENGEFVMDENGNYVHGEKAVYTWPNGRSYTGYFESDKIVAIEE